MDTALSYWMTILRDKKTTSRDFRHAAERVSNILAYQVMLKMQTTSIPLETPLAKTQGIMLQKSIMIVPILRSGLAMLNPFMQMFENAKIGIVGLKRDEKTAVAAWYYHNLPTFDKNTQVIIIDPMIATGGTALQTISYLHEQDIPLSNIMMACIVSAPEGINLINEKYPEVSIICAAHDTALTKDKFIIPGLGDFGDRYFGTEA